MPSRLIQTAAVVALALASIGATAQQRPVNDTGVISCTNETWAGVTCESVNATLPGQDAAFGRDAMSVVGSLNKTGAGSRGFDFTKIGVDGSVVAATATFGAAAGQYFCVRDNTTGLVWQASGAVRVWRDPNPATNGGFVGAENAGNTTDEYIAAENTANRCGTSRLWRLPTVRELLSVVAFSNPSAVWWGDFGFFGGLPNTQYALWTSQTNPAFPEYALMVVVSYPGCVAYAGCYGSYPNAVLRKDSNATKTTGQWTVLVSSQ